MSHYTVVVCLDPGVARGDLDDALAAALEPFDENKEVEERTDEDDGSVYWHNPQAKWDWWVVGGRWHGYFIPAEGAARDALVHGESGSFGNAVERYIGPDRVARRKVDGGRKRALDFEAMRTEATHKAGEDWDEYAAVIAGTPQHTPWSEFRQRVELAEAAAPVSWEELCRIAHERALAEVGATNGDEPQYGTDPYKKWQEVDRRLMDLAREQYNGSLEYTIDAARREYADQPRIQRLREHPAYKRRFLDSPESQFEMPRDEYVSLQLAKAVPGYSTLRIDGRWLAPGSMGWFGMSDDDADSYAYYVREANAYLDGLDPDAWLVLVDAHI